MKHETQSALVIAGPTASGKTALGVQLAGLLNGEILSADSRQVYRGLDIGSGKDLSEYVFEGRPIPYHLIDIAEVTQEFSVFHYKEAFYPAYDGVCRRGRLPVRMRLYCSVNERGEIEHVLSMPRLTHAG